MKKSILFLLGLTGFVVSGVWLLQEGGHEPIIALCVSLAALLTDFLWLSQGKISVEALKKKPNDELRTIARHLQIGGITSMAKDELVIAIENAQKVKYPISYRWTALKWLAVICSILLIPLLNRIFPRREDIPPKFNLAWYEQTDNGLKIVDHNNAHKFLEADDILNNRIRLPIHLAIRNADNVPLQVVRVELHYDKGLKVFSSGKARIDPEHRVLIYEHVIGTLEKVKEFTPLETIDVITVPYAFFVTPTVALTKDNVPMYMIIIASEGLLRKRHINLRFRVFCANRPPVTSQIRITLDTKLELLNDLWHSERTDVNETDHQYFMINLQHAKILTQWNRSHSLSGSSKLIDYKMVQALEGRMQFISVDGTLRRVAVDHDNDGNIDFTLVDSDGDNKPDLKFVFHIRWPLINWKAEAVK